MNAEQQWFLEQVWPLRNWLLAIACFHASPSDAEDCLQQAFSQMLNYLDRHPGPPYPGPRAWSRTILVRVCSRRAGAERRHRHAALPPEGVPAPDDTGGLLGGLVGQELRQRFRRALARLPEWQRRIVTLRMGGLPFGDIAAATGLRVGHCRVAYHRALCRLRDDLG